jgi:hypothetical protein
VGHKCQETNHCERAKGHEHPLGLGVEVRERVAAYGVGEEADDGRSSEERVGAEADIETWATCALEVFEADGGTLHGGVVRCESELTSTWKGEKRSTSRA